MRSATTVEVSGSRSETIDFVLEAERLGLDVCWVAEAWGSDAPSVLGYLAARTDRMSLGSGIIQIGTRTPVAIAQAALTLADLSDGRFLLGLGASGPQVISGLHGLPFDRPLRRMQENIDVIRQVFAGEKVNYHGDIITIPADDSTRPMRLSMAPNDGIPIYLAALSPKMLQLTGAVADGWLGTSFVPEGSSAYFEHLDAGLASAGRTRADLDVCQGAEIAIFDDEDAMTRHIAGRKAELAFSLGGMGSASTNFYNAAYSRQGWAEVAGQVRTRWQAGDRRGAAELITDDMVLATTLIGTREIVARRLRVWRDAGVDTVRMYPAGETTTQKLDNLAHGLELLGEINAEATAGLGDPIVRSSGDTCTTRYE
ncbi:LLM class flavin-dependent oxidoreductase [Gordonia sp. TBRC 11910]|uniref:LLM class flavin-dependent oxidoreductase n=1 Tax=Gordonia asplenii TaxID=2725283 RepID=A0A848KUA8_9ACTN|nr:LLM class flavin-dependent oxidoreductase [Gordonia asplenii]NMO02276.1 LLM class flavin-dependent oxidoreductase [Gordonia asplenii]